MIFFHVGGIGSDGLPVATKLAEGSAMREEHVKQDDQQSASLEDPLAPGK